MSPSASHGRVSFPPSVWMIGSEALPFSKTGGLADVLGALPAAVARLGWQVTLVLPRYRGTSAGELVDRLPLRVGGYVSDAGIYEARGESGVRVLLVDEPSLYDRDELYAAGGVDYPDNPRRFGVLVRAALDCAAKADVAPSIVHAHDWQAGLAPVYLHTMYAAHPVLGGLPSVLTIHNLAYQGVFDPDWLPRLDLPWSLFGIEQMEFWGRISFLKGAIVHASLVTTVSRQYAREIQTPEFGCGLDGVLRSRGDDLVGILNGIDTEKWDPATDVSLPERFSVTDASGKRAAKRAVLARFGLPVSEEMLGRPLVGMISRMVDQKGFDLIEALKDRLPELEATFIVLGTGDVRYQDLWRGLAALHPDRIAARIGFDEALAHLIEAGADLFLMPSRFEPCGLNQMYSLRYGTVPIVRRVGGLADTVSDHVSPEQAGTGFMFDAYTPDALLAAMRRALAVFRDRVQWQAIQAAGMALDHSWDRSAREYVRIYERAITKGAVNGSGERSDVYGR